MNRTEAAENLSSGNLPRDPEELISSATSAGPSPGLGHNPPSVLQSSKLLASGDVMLFKLPSVLQDCILRRLRPIDVIGLRLSCRAGLERLCGHLHLKFTGSTADVNCWQRLTTEATHVTLCGAVPTLQHLSNLTPQMPLLPALSNLVPALRNLVVLVIHPHRWSLGAPVFVTFSSWAHLPHLQLEVWSAEQDRLKLNDAIGNQPLMMPAVLENPLSCQAQNALVLVNNSEQPTKVVWRSGVDSLWIVSHGHLQIVQVVLSSLLQGVRQVCIAFPCFLSNGEAGELNIIAFSSKHPMPLHCSFDAWLETAEITLQQLALERFTYCSMNFIVSEGSRHTVVQRYLELTDGVYAGLASVR